MACTAGSVPGQPRAAAQNDEFIVKFREALLVSLLRPLLSWTTGAVLQRRLAA